MKWPRFDRSTLIDLALALLVLALAAAVGWVILTLGGAPMP